MGLQKFRADEAGATFENGSQPFYARWMGGPTLALIRNCPTPFGPRTVYVKGEADTYFTIPAKCRVRKTIYHGYLMFETGQGWTFRCNTQKKEG